MTEKPTYKELEQRVQELDTAESKCKQALQASLEKERSTRSLFDGIPVGLYRTAEDGRILDANSALADMLGFPDPQSLLFQDSAQFLVKPEEQIKQRNILEQEGVLHGYEVEFRRRDGSTFWVRDSARVFRGPDGQAFYEGSLEDITARKQAEKALRESEKKYRGLIEGLNDTIYRMTLPDGRYEYFSASVEEVFGYNSKEFINNPLLIQRIIHPDYAGYFKEKWKELLEGNIQETYEYKVIDPEGNERWIVQSNKAIFDDSGKIEAIEGLCRNVTERKEAELLLEAERAQLRSLFEYSGEAILLLDLENHILDANSGFEGIFGYSLEEARGEIIEDLICPERFRYTEAKELDEQSLNGIKDVEIIRKRKDGEEIDVRVSAGPIKLGDRITGRFVVFDDITERKQAEEALNNERSFLSAVLDNIEEAVVTCDREGRLLRFNEAARRLHGLPEQPIPPDQWADYYDLYRMDGATPLPTEEIPLFRALKGERVQNAEIVVAPKHGGARFMVCSGQALTSDAGEVVGAVVAMHDITERKKAEEALRDSESRFQRMLAVVPDMISIQNPQMDILYSNWAGFGAVPESRRILNTKCYRTFRGFDDICPDCRAKSVLKSGQAIQEEIQLPDGRWFDIRVIPILEKDNHVEMFMEWVRDITERKQAEEEREKLNGQLAQSQKLEAIGSLAGGVAHDLNNLLSPILGYGEMLRDDLDPEDMRRESVDEIIGAGLRARDLIRQLLAFSRKQILEFKPLNLNKVAAGLERLLRYTIREDIQMEFDLTPDAGVVMADISQIEQVIMNLSVNAADAMPEGGELTIETQKVYLDEEYANHHTSVKPGEYVMLAVSDSGIGMDEATRENIFEPFFSTKGESGTGLGLATVYGIVKQHGGNIWVYSEPGKGSTFKVYLPVVETSEPKETTSAETINDLKGSETILIVEDSDQVRRLAESVLKRNGYQVLTAKDGAEALEAMASHDHPVNLLLTDVVLPGMNGRELYEKAAEASPSMKVLFMSGYTDNVIAHRGVLDEGIQFIQKPFTVYGLAVKVREVLDEKPRK